MPIWVMPVPVELKVRFVPIISVTFDALPICVRPVPLLLMLTVGETSPMAPAAVLPIVVVPVPVVLIPRDASRIGFGTACVGTVSVTAPVPPTGETVRFAFADAIEVTPPPALPVAAIVTTPIPSGGVTVIFVPPTMRVTPPPPCCVAITFRYAKTEDVLSELATTIGARPDILK